MRRPDARRRSASGFTLVELLLALGLFALLAVALVRLVDTSVRIWARTESDRDLTEMASALFDWLEADLQAIETGPRGDVVAEWVRFDVDQDGLAGAVWPRLRVVRQRHAPLPQDEPPIGEPDAGARFRAGLTEVCWALLPAKGAEADSKPHGILWRGERPLADDALSFFDPSFFDAAERPLPGSLEYVTGGVLWLEVLFAAQTSVIADGWQVGDELWHCAASWDARALGRPDLESSYLNAPAAGMPARDGDLPLLPRRVRIALELERPADLRHRTRLIEEVEPGAREIFVADGDRLPGPGDMILIGEEWLELGARGGDAFAVTRARRGTRATLHPAGALIHFGRRAERELVLPPTGEDWDL